MAETKIDYIIPDAPNHQPDYETILASIGKYQDKMNPNFPNVSYVPHTTEIQENEGVVRITFRRDLRDVTPHDTAHLIGRQSAKAEIRADIERQFPEDLRAALSRYYVDIPEAQIPTPSE
jgi:hypothetical protein